jgi:hypothetical protein
VYGATFDRTHSYAYMLWLSSLFFVGGALLLLTLGPYRRFDGSAASCSGDGSPTSAR